MDAEVLLSKRVQDMCLDGDKPAKPYLCRDGDNVEVVPASLSHVPIIDLGLIDQENEVVKLRSALSSWGCFQVSLESINLNKQNHRHGFISKSS